MPRPFDILILNLRSQLQAFEEYWKSFGKEPPDDEVAGGSSGSSGPMATSASLSIDGR